MGAGFVDPYRQHHHDLGFCVQPLAYLAGKYKTGFVGGIFPGSMPAKSRHIQEEGVISEGLKIVDKGHFQEAA